MELDKREEEMGAAAETSSRTGRPTTQKHRCDDTK